MLRSKPSLDITACCVHSSGGRWNHIRIPEVVGQSSIVGKEKASPTRQCKGEYVPVVGGDDPAELSVCFLDPRLPYLPNPPTKSSSFQEPSFEVLVVSQFSNIVFANNEFSSITVQPLPESPSRLRLFRTHQLMHDVGINDGTHQYFIIRFSSSVKKLRYPSGALSTLPSSSIRIE